MCRLHPLKMGERGKSQVKVVLEGGQSDVPWWFGLGRVEWRSGCHLVTPFKSAVCVLYDFWGAGGIWVENKGYRKLQKALSYGYSQRDCFMGY